MPDELEEIISEFLTEAEETLDRIDPLFVEVETKGPDRDILNEIFRSMHTIKGAAGFLGFQNIVEVAHGAENVLKRLRDGEMTITRHLTDVILKSVDMLKVLLGHLRAKDGKEEEIAPLMKDLNDAMNNAQGKGTGAASRCNTEEAEENVCSHSLFSPHIPPGIIHAAGKPGRDPLQSSCSGKHADLRSPAAEECEKEKTPPDKEAIQTLRVDVGKIDKVMDLTGEVVLARNRLLNTMNYLEMKYPDDPHIENLLENVSFLDLVTSDLQVAVMKIRMQPIKKVFNRFPRLVRDISGSLGKDVDLKISGESTEADRSVMEYIGDPMVHIIRNAVDHGLEPVDERTATGKPKKGTITINAYQKGSQIVIEVSDDGRGIDVQQLRKTAVRKALITEEESLRMGDNEVLNLIFLPGFSTVDIATELSGRGVGMDVVKTNISRLNGYIDVATAKGQGTTFRISIPLTLAIINVLMVRSGGAHYAIPLTPIEETLKVSKADMTDVLGQRVINIRGRVLPIFELSDILGNSGSGDQDGRYVVVISMGEIRFCLAIDELLGQEEIVIKALSGMYSDSACVLGATITGDGRVVLILDPAGISRIKLGLAKA